MKFNYFDNICGIFGSFEDIYLYFDAILLKISNFVSCKIVYNLYWRILLDFYTYTYYNIFVIEIKKEVIIMDMFLYIILIVAAGIVPLLPIIFIYGGANKNKSKPNINRYEEVHYGMTQQQVIEIMGSNYMRSLLADGRVEFLYKVAGYSVATYTAGMRIGGYERGKSVRVYFRNNSVIEVRCS